MTDTTKLAANTAAIAAKDAVNGLAAESRTTILDAMRSISKNADELKDCHTVDGDWGNEIDAKATYEAEVRLIDRLGALLADVERMSEAMRGAAVIADAAGKEISSLKSALSTQQPGTLPYPIDLTEVLFDVLSLMLWDTGPIAHVLRAGGADIKKRAEDEQAHVLHWLIQLALQHGPAWRERALTSINEIRAATQKTPEVPA
ncbi:hypothetical protein [Cupriavidus metallidurans]|uniref:hypothetical protein n=1 Tax=Cupriavidus metallidurans TaxID=119219 RepID=UPI000CE046D0|nr:hypothetical protein [Cupriavidus metallidurans]AVA32981.1 hypothetical protein C3Z06_04665 [Cupriavidus metallidurans]